MKKLAIILTLTVMAVIFAVAANAAVGTVVYGVKTDHAPNMEEIDDSWGEPAIYVTKDSPNSELAKYWTVWNDTAEGEHSGTGPQGRTTFEPEDSDFWMYFLYDDKNIYVAFKTPDYHIAGSEEKHRGDGIHMWLQPLESMTDPYGSCGCSSDMTSDQRKTLQSQYYFYWNLAFDDYSTDTGNACDLLDEKPVIYQYDDELHCIIQIPLAFYGLRNKDVHGFEFGISVLRCSSTGLPCPSGEFTDEGYSGWLNWGKFMASYTSKPKSVNTVILMDPARGVPGNTTETEPEPVIEPNLDGVSSWAKDEVEAAILAGIVPEALWQNYTSPITRGQVAEMFIKLIEKVTGYKAASIIEKKGITVNTGKFTDTTDENVLMANALGIINGTSDTKFSPDGTLKRAQIAALINRVAKFAGRNTEGLTHDFTDITDNYKWVDAELGWPVANGVINGVGQGRFNPGGDLTTEQAILIVYRALKALKN